MTSVEEIQAKHAEMKRQINDPRCTEFMLDPALQVSLDQLGFSPVVADQLGRLWMAENPNMAAPFKLRMIFDPNWLHPSKRWAGPRQVPRG